MNPVFVVNELNKTLFTVYTQSVLKNIENLIDILSKYNTDAAYHAIDDLTFARCDVELAIDAVKIYDVFGDKNDNNKNLTNNN